MADTEREAFEAWASNEFPDYFMDKDPVGDYYAEPIDVSWKGWRAALASRPAEVDYLTCDLCKGTGETKMRAVGAVWHHTCARCKGKGLAPSHTTNKEK